MPSENQPSPDYLTREETTDIELVFWLSRHIDNPCETANSSGEKINLRNIYIREAKRILPSLKDKDAIEVLKNKLAEYENT